MRILATLRSRANSLAFASIFLLLLITIILTFSVLRLTTQVNAMKHEVEDVKQDITCGQVFHNGMTNKDTCIGMQDQLNDIQQRLQQN
jgi:fumarate reductase subunit D